MLWESTKQFKSLKDALFYSIKVYYSQPDVCTWHLFCIGRRPGTWLELTRGSVSSDLASSESLQLVASDSSILMARWSFPLHRVRTDSMSELDLVTLVSSIEAMPESRYTGLTIMSAGCGLGDVVWRDLRYLSWPDEARDRGGHSSLSSGVADAEVGMWENVVLWKWSFAYLLNQNLTVWDKTLATHDSLPWFQFWWLSEPCGSSLSW